MRPLDLDPKLVGEDPGRSAMIDMAVGEQDLLDRDPGLRSGFLQLRQVAAGIDERAAHGLRAPDQAAILLEGGHRDDRGTKRRLAHLAGPNVAIERRLIPHRRRHRFRLAKHPQHIAAGELGEIGVAPAAADQFGEQQRIAVDAAKPGGRDLDAVEIAADADMIVAGDLGDVLDVIGDLRRPWRAAADARPPRPSCPPDALPGRWGTAPSAALLPRPAPRSTAGRRSET